MANPNKPSLSNDFDFDYLESLLDLAVPSDSMSSRFEPGVPDEQPFSNMFLPSDNWDDDDFCALIDNGDIHTPSQDCFVGVSQTISCRRTMEDAFIVLGAHGVFGVFDGHNGDEAARIASRILRRELVHYDAGDKERSIQTVIDAIHARVINSTASGTTATLCFVDEHTVAIANVGDSPAFVRTTDSRFEKVSEDHVASNPAEEERVKLEGGTVVSVYGVKRVKGTSMVTRAIGDAKLQPFLRPTAHVVVMERSAVEYVVLASDGVTDKVGGDEINAIVSTIRNEAAAATIVRNLAYQRGGRDNITCVIVRPTRC